MHQKFSNRKKKDQNWLLASISCPQHEKVTKDKQLGSVDALHCDDAIE